MDFQNYNQNNNDEQQFAGFEPNGMGQDPFFAQTMPPIIMNDGKKESTAAMVLGIIGVALGFICFFVLGFLVIASFVCSLLGIIYGVKGKRLSRAATGTASGQATAGLVLGIIGVVVAAIALLVVFFTVVFAVAILA